MWRVVRGLYYALCVIFVVWPLTAAGVNPIVAIVIAAVVAFALQGVLVLGAVLIHTVYTRCTSRTRPRSEPTTDISEEKRKIHEPTLRNEDASSTGDAALTRPNIRIRCPGCEKTLSVKRELAGRRAKCLACGQHFKVPQPKAIPGPHPGNQAMPIPAQASVSVAVTASPCDAQPEGKAVGRKMRVAVHDQATDTNPDGLAASVPENDQLDPGWHEFEVRFARGFRRWLLHAGGRKGRIAADSSGITIEARLPLYTLAMVFPLFLLASIVYVESRATADHVMATSLGHRLPDDGSIPPWQASALVFWGGGWRQRIFMCDVRCGGISHGLR